MTTSAATSTTRTSTDTTTKPTETTGPTETSQSTATSTSIVIGLPDVGNGQEGGVPAPFNYARAPSLQFPPRPAQPLTAAQPGAPPPGLAAAAGVPPIVVPVVLPVIVPPLEVPLNAPDSDRGPRSGPDMEPTTKLRIQTPTPVAVGLDAAIPPVSFRVGYTDYLRTASTIEIAAMALPGVTGMMALTGLGGFVGYRQAKAGRTVRIDATRFMP
ncbi:hypothetical protein [Mycobacterium sp. GA-1841]|uniref:hypothetical protein n=1 Tax=Mycobacterium sp. GA-1841 TaxID=1834154 RepID=UPI0020C9F62E|nr:hypothetical protein [Mycobacterium sp. GA-1841]